MSEERCIHATRRRQRWGRVCGVLAVAGIVAVTGASVECNRRLAIEVDALNSVVENGHRPVREAARQDGGFSMPDIEWPHGLPDDGEWAEDVWVQTLREFSKVYAIAYNERHVAENHDLLAYADWEYLDSVQDGLDVGEVLLRDRLTNGPRSERLDLHYPGPQPFEVLAVMGDDARATVDVCRPDVLVTGGDVPSARVMSATSGFSARWHLRRDDDGRPVISSGTGDGRLQCEITDVRFGLFDPPPTPIAEVKSRDGG